MNSPQPAPGLANRDVTAQGLADQRPSWTRRLVVALVALVVIAEAGAAFVFSYDGVRAIALLGGMSAQLARYYPGLFDAVLVIACVAAVMLRDGRWWARLWAWLVIAILVGTIGAADVVHAANYTLRHRTTEGIVAAAPVVAVLLAFSLLLTLLRKSRTPPPAAPAATPPDVPALPAAVPAAPIALPAAPVAPVAPPAVAGVPVAEPQDVPAPPTVPVPVTATTAAPPTEPVPVTAPLTEPGPAAPPTEPVPVTASLTEPGPVPEGRPVLEGEPTQPVPVITESPETPRDALSADGLPQENEAAQKARPSAEPTGMISAAAPAAEAEAKQDEPAPPTVEVPAVAPQPQGIRYAGSTARNTPKPADYWDTEDAGQFAGVVYRAREDDDTLANKPPARSALSELDDNAPPFATAPFAPASRLNRVRSMPAPPSDEDEDEDE